MKSKLFLLLFCLPILGQVQAQIDTTAAAKNVKKSIFHIDSQGNIDQKPTKDIGNKIPHLVVFNLANKNVEIKLSLDRQAWNNFSLDATSKNIYRCDAIQTMYIMIDPTAKYPIKSKILRNKKYIINYDSTLQTFTIVEII